MTIIDETKEMIPAAREGNPGSVVARYLWVGELVLLAVYIVSVIAGMSYNDKGLITALLMVVAILYLTAGIWGRERDVKWGWGHFIKSGGLIILAMSVFGIIYYFRGWPMANVILIIIALGLILVVLLTVTTIKESKTPVASKIMLARFLTATIVLLSVILLEFIRS